MAAKLLSTNLIATYMTGKLHFCFTLGACGSLREAVVPHGRAIQFLRLGTVALTASEKMLVAEVTPHSAEPIFEHGLRSVEHSQKAWPPLV